MSKPQDPGSEAPSQPQPSSQRVSEEQLEIAERAQESTLKETLSRPSTVAAIVVGLAIALGVIYLEFFGSKSGLPVPEVSYTLLPNEGRTDGVPIAIKINQVTVFVIDDPLVEDSGALRAKALVDKFQNMVSDLKENPGKAITFTETGPYPAIILQDADATNRRTLVQLTKGDVTLAGGGDPKRVARVWSERLTDALKVLAFGEAPEFSTGTAYGDALTAMYAAARAGGTITEGSLDDAYEQLTDSQKLALETMPALAPEPTTASSR